MIKTVDGITAPFILNCKFRFMDYKLKYEKFHYNLRKNFSH